MGDRGNVVLRETTFENSSSEIYLYSHWGGYNLPETLRKALEHGKGRWTDPPYLNRILIDQVFKGERDEETGAGVSTYITDNEYPLLIVDHDTREVYLEQAQGGPLARDPRFSFAEFVHLAETLERAVSWADLGYDRG